MNSYSCLYSCNKITKTWIQISRQNWNGFFSNINHQRMIYLAPIVFRSKTKGINTKKIRNCLYIHDYRPNKFWKTMIRWSFCAFLIVLLLYWLDNLAARIDCSCSSLFTSQKIYIEGKTVCFFTFVVTRVGNKECVNTVERLQECCQMTGHSQYMAVIGNSINALLITHSSFCFTNENINNKKFFDKPHVF